MNEADIGGLGLIVLGYIMGMINVFLVIWLKAR